MTRVWYRWALKMITEGQNRNTGDRRKNVIDDNRMDVKDGNDKLCLNKVKCRSHEHMTSGNTGFVSPAEHQRCLE